MTELQEDLIDLHSSDENGSLQLQTEVQEYLTIRQQRCWIFPRAALVGLITGLVALLFRILLAEIDQFRMRLIHWSHSLPYGGWIFPVLFTMTGVMVSFLLVQKVCSEAAGSGIPFLEAVLQRFRKIRWRKLLPVKFIAGVFAIGSGLAVGREGPTVQMGGAIGDMVGRFLKTTRRERSVLISAGAGAGLAAAFNAPLSGLIFVLEEVRRDFQPIVFGATFIAAVVADIIARMGTGQFPVFTVPNYPVLPLTSLPFFAILGALAGVLGVLFNQLLMAALQKMDSLPSRFVIPSRFLIGGAVGLIGWFSPVLWGGGHFLAEEVLRGVVLLKLIPLFFLIRLFMTVTSYSTGVAGGIFAPLLVLGALIGLGCGKAFQFYFPTIVTRAAVFAVVGMAAYFTAIVRAPLTGIMLILEMTGSYSQMLPLLVSCFIAYIVAEAMRNLPVYESLLERDLRKTGASLAKKHPAVVELLVQDGALFAGKKIRDLQLPAGVIIVRCSDGKQEWIPTADTKIESSWLITVVIAPEVCDALMILHDGCDCRV